METTTQPNDGLAGSVLFYTQPEPLTPEQHGNLGVNPTATPFRFVRQSHVVPLTVTEFAPACLSYPIIFVGEGKTPLAVMGLRENANLFVDETGAFRPDAYVPAFVRRYPFVFANDPQNDRLLLCIDRNADFLTEDGQVKLFEDGKPSAYTEQAMNFCRDFEGERRRTESFVELLKTHDLFDVREAFFTPTNPDGTQGQPQKIADYFAVSEDKLKALPAETLVELRDNGALGQIYAHMLSLQGWDRLIALAMVEAMNQPTAANA
ncbi:SapC family protein [Brevundimonas sp. 2R-24]|uniref:SapC family protein n=1 Tax=Peiella sedimenti TaxID=3061083 RepID=A0ABT8SL10_9CAUL|nr:SapC family protein [Caulobacteraceae bacterium XZ-24]